MNKYSLIGKIGYFIFKVLSLTMIKKQFINNKYFDNDQYIVVFWHKRLFAAANATRFIKNKAALVSPSKDGDILAELLKGEKNKVIRGSSNRDNVKSLKEILRYIKNKYTIGIAIDGPKGPIFEPKGGAIYLAQKSNLKMVVADGYFTRKWTLKTWDKFEIPKPFSKMYLYIGEPFEIPKEMNIEEATKFVKIKMKENNDISYEMYCNEFKINREEYKNV